MNPLINVNLMLFMWYKAFLFDLETRPLILLSLNKIRLMTFAHW